MRAAFTYAIRYWIEATCDSPMRTGNSANDIDQILTAQTGVAMLQGASIAGAMRAWIEDEQMQTLLFGSEKKEGSIRITDALFDQKDIAGTRPRVQIDNRTATVNNKFDIATLPSGAKCKFELLWLGHKDAVYTERKKQASSGGKQGEEANPKADTGKEKQSLGAEEAAKQIRDCLCAIEGGAITFGAQRSNGFGRMKLSVRKRAYDMMVANDRMAWLNDSEDGTEPVVLTPWQPEGIIFDVEAYIPSILIKASAPERRKGQTVQVHYRENEEPILPGSSLKGAMRAHMQRIAPFLFPGLNIPAMMTSLLGNTPKKEETAVAGKLIWTDAMLAKNRNRRVRETTRIRLNRLTSGPIQRALITEESICGDWQWRIRIPSSNPAGAMLVLYALRDLGLGIYQLGGTKGIGRGTVDRITVKISNGTNEAALKVEDGKTSLEDAGGIVAKWETQMGGSKHED